MDQNRCNEHAGEEQFGFHTAKFYRGNRVSNKPIFARVGRALAVVFVDNATRVCFTRHGRRVAPACAQLRRGRQRSGYKKSAGDEARTRDVLLGKEVLYH